MEQSTLIIFAVLVVQAYSAPQFITFTDGVLGVNFAGYHAGVGIGGQGGSGKAGGGLFAEAGTPFGPAARAGLGGAVDGQSSSGGLFAGATAGGGVKSEASLGGAVSSGKAVGGGYATAQAGPHSATAVLDGEKESSGGADFSFVAHKSVGTVIEPAKEHKKVHGDVNIDAYNEIAPVANADVEAHADAGFNVNANANAQAQPAVFVKEVNVPTEVIVRKHKPHRHHAHKTVYVGGYVGAGGNVGAPVVKVQPIEKRVDVGVESGANFNVEHEAPKVTYNKEVVVTHNRPSTFFQDIFNIPISTLKAVSGFLTNTAGNTNISIQKSGSVKTESDLISSKHDQPSSSASSEAQISVQTPSASKIIDDIFAIPINTLSAVNKFLENNVSGRKRVQASVETDGEPTRVRLGPHARRRANKHVVIVQEAPTTKTESKEDS
ncbi:unnamed protein product [Chrysodeixis includens]|uniref:Uncharacterized protein n=1 Tax=Chrysodeixis includens TaxID=689277 RepID=A0A9P0FR48_CHRIL|nr:unnamed protein product [Chrysodeixis includens]